MDQRFGFNQQGIGMVNPTDALAQLVELRIPDPKVGSSSLSRITKYFLFFA